MTMRAPAVLFLLTSLIAGGGVAAQESISRTIRPTLRPSETLALSVSTPLGGDPLVVEGFHGQESMSSLFSFTLDVAAPRSQEIPFDALLGKEVTVTVPLPGGAVRHFNGICNRISQGDTDLRAHYHLELAPRLWLLTRRAQSRIFQDTSVPRIVAQLLGAVPGLAYEMHLTGTYPPRNYAVQHNETDFAFLSRLLEEEGIFYYFKHGADGHVMVLADAPQGYTDIPGLHPYRPAALFPPGPGTITSWEKSQEIRSGRVTLWDHSFQAPGENYESQATIQEAVVAGTVEHHLAAGGGPALELFDFPGGYAKRFDGIGPGGEERRDDLDQILPTGARAAGTRMQEEAAQALVVHGTSTAPDLAAGHTFTLDGLSSKFNGKYLVTGVTHTFTPGGFPSGGYRNEISGIPSGLPYRPPRRTPKPVMAGMETAVVIAPPDQDVFSDKYARVKVKFHWDRTGQDPQDDGSTSCWIRVASPWAGAGGGPGSGPLIIPRVGWEVVVAFLDGDPDQPIIVGSVYNAEHLPPPPER